MSKEYEITVDAHPNIYNNNSNRKLRICFSEPDNGVNDKTGLLMIIPGFGGCLDSRVYKKMRSTFADEYNLVTIQCDYFGLEFMQNEILEETEENFNDMGPLQSIDIISSVIIMQEVLRDNNLVYNKDKIIAYGHSHGAYLAFLANVFAPDLFNLIIDNSSWLIPNYLFLNRELIMSDGEKRTFEYLAGKMIDIDLEIYNLRYLYNKINNNCLIYSFHGVDDRLISLENKKKLLLPMKKSKLFEIGEKEINEIFRSKQHGLDADYVKMFDYVMKDLKPNFNSRKRLKQKAFRLDTSKFSYLIDYEKIVPTLIRERKKFRN